VSDSEYGDDFADDQGDAVHYYYPYRHTYSVLSVPMMAFSPQESTRQSAMRIVSESLRKLVELGEDNVEEDMRKRLITMQVLRAAIDSLSDQERESIAETIEWNDAAAQFGDEYDDSLRSLILSLHTITV
jgi:hypothetical protein